MIGQKWHDSIEGAREFLDVATILPEAESNVRIRASAPKSQLAELRRRIEERLDSKRIAHEYEYEDEYD